LTLVTCASREDRPTDHRPARNRDRLARGPGTADPCLGASTPRRSRRRFAPRRRRPDTPVIQRHGGTRLSCPGRQVLIETPRARREAVPRVTGVGKGARRRRGAGQPHHVPVEESVPRRAPNPCAARTCMSATSRLRTLPRTIWSSCLRICGRWPLSGRSGFFSQRRVRRHQSGAALAIASGSIFQRRRPR